MRQPHVETLKQHQRTIMASARVLPPERQTLVDALTCALQAIEREDEYRAACEAALTWILGHYVEGDEHRAQARDRLQAALAADEAPTS